MRLQRTLLQRRRDGLAPDTLLLLEHSPVFTLGRLQKLDAAQNILASPEAIAAAGASVAQSDRGGNITFHGPGQLVAYPILDLRGYRKDLRWFVGALEDTMIRTAAAFGVEASRGVAGEEGVWVGERKLGALGVRVQRWVSSHGLALNANPDLAFFDMIVPCGLQETPGVTSLSAESSPRTTVSVDDVVPRFLDAFGELFGAAPYELEEEEWERDARRDGAPPGRDEPSNISDVERPPGGALGQESVGERRA